MKDVGMSTCKLSTLLFLLVCFFVLPSLLYSQLLFVLVCVIFFSMIANHHKTFQCQLSYFNYQLPVLAVVYLMQDLHFQIMLLDGSFIHVDMIPSHVYCYNAKAVVFLADR